MTTHAFFTILNEIVKDKKFSIEKVGLEANYMMNSHLGLYD